MGGISSGVGLISGINTDQLISQLLAADSGPVTQAQQRVSQFQAQQAAYLGLSGNLSALYSAGQAFRVNNVFQSATASSSDTTILNATAATGAISGSYTFTVNQVASAQQQLSGAFADRSNTSLGLNTVYVESDEARLDSSTSLSQFNGGNGITRGKIQVTDGSGNTATIDLSTAASANDVLGAFNTNSTVHVNASVQNGQFIVKDTSGGTGTLRISSAQGSSTAESLGLAKSAVSGTITGDNVYTIGDNTSIQTLNDGNGIRFNTAAGIGANSTPDFSVTTADGSTLKIDIGNTYDGTGTKTGGPVTTVGQLRARIQTQSGGKLDLQVRSDGRGLQLIDKTTGSSAFAVTDDPNSGAATDLGLVGTGTGGTITGKAVLSGINSVLTSSLNGGQGVSDGTFSITSRSGTAYNFTVDPTKSVSDILQQISSQTNGAVTASLSNNGNSLVLNDTTGGTGNLIVTGAGATALGIATATGGVAASSVAGSRIARQYITSSTPLATLNGGAGIGTGTFSITGANGNKVSVNITSSQATIGDVITQINSQGSQAGIVASVDDSGSGIVIKAAAGVTSPQPIAIADTTGTVAKSLNLVGTATLASNQIDGSFREAITLTPADTLDAVVTKINAARAGVSAAVISDGNPVTPYRLQLTSTQSGESGRVIIDTSGASSLNLSTVANGNDARIFVGSTDPAKAILVTRPSNSIDGIIDNVHVNITGTSDTPVTLTVARDDSAITSAVNSFVTAFNTTTTQINTLTSYNSTTQQSGTLFGDSLTTNLQNNLLNAILQPAQGVSGKYQYFSQVGITVDNNGQLSFDSTKLQAALNDDPAGVANLFAAHTQAPQPPTVPVAGVPGVSVNNTSTNTYTSLGLGEILAQVADKYTNSTTGIFTTAKTNLDDQITSQNTRITSLNAQLASKKTILQNQFNAMEQALSQLQSQQTSLANIAAA